MFWRKPLDKILGLRTQVQIPSKMPVNARHVHQVADPEFVIFPSRRSVVHSAKGIVSSTQPLASQAGIRILNEGGNAAVSTIGAQKVACVSDQFRTLQLQSRLRST